MNTKYLFINFIICRIFHSGCNTVQSNLQKSAAPVIVNTKEYKIATNTYIKPSFTPNSFQEQTLTPNTTINYENDKYYVTDLINQLPQRRIYCIL